MKMIIRNIINLLLVDLVIAFIAWNLSSKPSNIEINELHLRTLRLLYTYYDISSLQLVSIKYDVTIHNT